MQARAANLSSIYVAVVDDDPSVCRSFGRLLRTAGFQLVTYPSAEALLQDSKRPRFDCLVLDIQLDGMSGLELARRIRALRDNTPIIFITALEDPEVRTEVLACGAAEFFRKTDPGERVLEAIRRAVGNHDAGATPKPPPTNSQG